MADDEKRLRWERATAWPGIAASALFLVVYTWQVLDQSKPPTLAAALLVVIVAIWSFFAVDYVVRITLASDKWLFVRKNPIDLLSVLLPAARPFRLITGLRHLRGLRGNTPSHLRRRVIIIAALAVLMFIYVISLAELQAERDAPGANIKSFGDALWWAAVTMATVGYGDYYPVTVTGRLLAVVLMIGGIAVVGTSSATIVSYLAERTQTLRIARRNDEEGEDPPGDEREP
ncbi:potassium channel family protein [Leifsonia sp. AG29]|uniref:potassium channel family protein n=1 Tax=Leifsonia sp. AG29 TaxID=2598860 RepID=UPI001E30A9D3|nr:potassium channel family protein [Leifsonia sp. AG29]